MKKLLALAACLMLLSAITVNGTLAFSFDGILNSLTSIFKSKPVNNEQQLKVDTLIQVRGANGMVSASESEMLLPANYSDGFDWQATQTATINGHNCLLWPESGVRGTADKFISVQNCSPDKEVYFRTAISIHKDIFPLLKINLNNTGEYRWTAWQLDGSYMTSVATYTTTLDPGMVSPPMMYQIALQKNVTNQQLAAFGTKMEIIKTNTLAVDAATFVNSDKTPMTDAQALAIFAQQ